MLLVSNTPPPHPHTTTITRNNAPTHTGSTPLHWAARGGHLDCTQTLLAVPTIEVNVANKLGDTALHGAAWKGQVEMITLLLEGGADRTLKNKAGELPYDLASRSADAQRLLRVTAAAAAAAAAKAAEEDYGDSDGDED
jgi:ankyrin repeat protein